MLRLSGIEVSSFKIQFSFSTGSDSPVSADSSVFRFWQLIILASAGTLSPLLKTTMSPKVKRASSISSSKPSLTVTARPLEKCFKAFITLFAFDSWKVPIEALKISTNRIITPSESSPMYIDTKVATSNTYMRGLLN